MSINSQLVNYSISQNMNKIITFVWNDNIINIYFDYKDIDFSIQQNKNIV